MAVTEVPAGAGCRPRAAVLQALRLLRGASGGRARRRGRARGRQERLDRVLPPGEPRARRGSPSARGRRSTARAGAAGAAPAAARTRRRRARRTPSTSCSCARTSAATSAWSTAARSRSPSSAAARGSRACPGWARRSPTTPTRWRWARSCSRCCAPRRSRATSRAGCPLHAEHDHHARGRSRASSTPVRDHGFAVDREEFDEDFCCVAAPMLDDARPARRRSSACRRRRARSTPSTTSWPTAVLRRRRAPAGAVASPFPTSCGKARVSCRAPGRVIRFPDPCSTALGRSVRAPSRRRSRP